MNLENPMTSPSEYDVKYGQRLSRLESEVQNLDGKIDAVASAVRDIAANISHMQKAPWQTLLGAGSLIVTIVSVIGLLALQPIRNDNLRQDTAIIEMVAAQNQHLVQQSGDFASFSVKLDDLEEKMFILNEIQDEKLKEFKNTVELMTEDRYSKSEHEYYAEKIEKEFETIKDDIKHQK